MSNYRLQVATATHKGDREYQQDRVQVFQHPYARKCLLFIVADGMGGQSGGAMASGQAVDTAEQLFQLFDPKQDDPAELLRRIVLDAHAVIRILNVSSEHEPHTTLAAFVVMPDGNCHWIHSGDSRIYHFNEGYFRGRTLDHSYVQSLISRGELTEEMARHHPKSNLLLGCLGMEATPPFDEFHMGMIEAGDVLLACSDGLWAYVNDKEMAKITGSLSPKDACNQLVALARERAMGGGDNLSMLILKASPIPVSHSHPEA